MARNGLDGLDWISRGGGGGGGANLRPARERERERSDSNGGPLVVVVLSEHWGFYLSARGGGVSELVDIFDGCWGGI